LQFSLEAVDVDPRCIVICGTRGVGHRNKEQGLIWIVVLVIKPKELCELFAESPAPTKSGKMIDAT
jgi:hypothetical protein